MSPPAPQLRAQPYLLVTARRGDRVVARSNATIRIDSGPPELLFPLDDVTEPGAGTIDGGFVTFGDDVVIEQTDSGVRNDDPIAFPNWGDVSDLVNVMNVADATGEGTQFTCHPRADWRRPIVEASQMLGQAIVAAGRREDRRPVHTSMVFTRPADAWAPYDLTLDPLTQGRNFSALGTTFHQHGKPCGSGTMLLDATADDVIEHGAAPPDVGTPDDAVPFDMGVTGRQLRVVDAAYTGDPEAPVGPPVIDAWVRLARLPDDPALHAGLMAQFTGHMSIAAAMRPHAGVGQNAAHVTLSTAINAISLSIHRPIHADRWMLYHHHATVSAGGMTHSECRVFEDGATHVASFTVGAMVRAFERNPNDPARAL